MSGFYDPTAAGRPPTADPTTSSSAPPPPPKPSAAYSPSHTPTSSSLPPGPLLPPTPIQQQQQQQQQSSSPRPQPPTPSHFSSQQQQQPQQQPHNPISPPHPSSHWLPPSLPEKSITDLQYLLSQPSLLHSLAQSHPSYASSQEPIKSLLNSNLALAKQLQQTETQLKSLRNQTAQLMLQHTSLQTQWRRKQSEMDDALSPWGPRNMYQRLVSSIGEQEAILKAMTESFIDGGGEHDAYGSGNGKASEKEVTEWIRRLREGTATLEKRREMRARWDEGRVGGWR